MAAPAIPVEESFVGMPDVLLVLVVAAAAACLVAWVRRRSPTSESAEVEHLQDRIWRISESEERFRQLAENIDALFFMRSVDPPRMLYVGPAYERI